MNPIMHIEMEQGGIIDIELFPDIKYLVIHRHIRYRFHFRN